MKREELERLRIDGDWRAEDFQTEGFELDMAMLLAAAPALALACIEARAHLRQVSISGCEVCVEIVEQIGVALAAAGVEAEP